MLRLCSLLFIAFWSLPGLADPYPLTLHDDRGVEVTLKERPNRVAALWAPAADFLVALDRPVAGVTTYEGAMPVYLGQGLAGAIDLGDITAPNFELLATSDFDLTVGMTRYNAPYADQIEPISAFLTFSAFTLDDSLASVEGLGTAFDVADQAREMNRKFLNLMSDYGARAPKAPRSVMLIWSFQDTLYGYQDNLTAPQIVAALGTVNPLGKNEDTANPDNAFVILEAEDLLAHDPDVILMFVSHGGQPKFNPAYERLTAYKAGRFYRIGYQYSQPSGPIARELVLREAAYLIYPETFEAPDMPEAARAVPVEFGK